jgi:hypothetical protein
MKRFDVVAIALVDVQFATRFVFLHAFSFSRIIQLTKCGSGFTKSSFGS